MKKYLFIAIVISFACSFDLSAQEKQDNFATKGVLEYGGGFGFSGEIYEKNTPSKSAFHIFIMPELNYYIIDYVHLGIVPVFHYSYYKYSYSDYGATVSHTFKTISCGPELSLGYTIKLTGLMFLDLSPVFGYLYYKTYSNNGSSDYKYEQIFYGLDLSLKYIIGTTIININLDQHYYDYSNSKNELMESNHYQFYVGLGLTAFIK
jgi:hypothetical protein